MNIFEHISFFEISMALLFVGLAERILLGYAPENMVGPKGWLLRQTHAE